MLPVAYEYTYQVKRDGEVIAKRRALDYRGYDDFQADMEKEENGEVFILSSRPLTYGPKGQIDKLFEWDKGYGSDPTMRGVKLSRIFNELAQAGSLRIAAENLGIPVPILQNAFHHIAMGYASQIP